MHSNSKKPVVAIFSTAYYPFIGGAEIAVENIAKKLARSFDFFIVTARLNRSLPKIEIRPEGTVVRVGMGNWLDKFLLPFLGALKMRRRADVLFGLDISTGSLGTAVFKFFSPRTPFIFNIQYGYGDTRLSRGRAGLINLAFRWMLSQADVVTVISTYLADVVRDYGYTGRVEIIPNSVDIKNFQNKKNVADPTVVTTSRLVHKNGIDILIRAIAEIKKDIPKIRCVLVGDGPERRRLEALTRELSLDENIKFVGDVSNEKIPAYLAAAHIFARPSRFEGMGISFVEALAAGVPVIATSVGGIPDIIRDGETGLFSNVDDPHDLAKKIKMLFTETALRDQLISNGKKLVEEKFTWDRISDSYRTLFKNIRGAKKRILIATGIFPPDIGGPATYSKILLDELPRRGVGVHVLSFSEVRHLPRVLRHIAYFFKALKMGKGADIIFAQDPVSVGLPAWLAATLLRKKFLIKIVGDYAWEQQQQNRNAIFVTPDEFQTKKFDFMTELRRKVEHFVVRGADKIIVPSEYLKKIVSMWGVDSQKIVVIYNAVNFTKMPFSKEEARTKLNLSGKILISAGRLVPWKGFDTLIKILPDLLKNFSDLKLIIVGDGPERDHLQHIAYRVKRSENIIFTGSLPKEKLLLYLKAADIFVLNTGYEGFSHQIPEAMFAGLPVLTTSIGGNPEIITDGIDGFLVNFNDKNAFTKKIDEIFSNEVVRRTVAEHAKKKSQEFSRERMINETIKLLNTL